MITKCNLCHKDLDNKKPNYITNIKCNCEFHFDCYNKQFPNYYSIYFPKCPNCYTHYRKEFIECSPDIIYEDAFNCWIGNNKMEKKLCKSYFCFNIAQIQYLNYCHHHFYKLYTKEEAIKLLKNILIYCIGLKSDKKLEVLKNIANQ